MKLLIAISHRFGLWNPPDWLAPRMRADFPQIDVVQIPDYERLEDELPDTDIAISWSIHPQQFQRARKLKWIHSTAAAVHQLIYPELVNSDVVLTNARSVIGAVVAEHALALMFALAKRLPSAVRFQIQSVWAQAELWNEQPRPRELRDSVVCLVGFGSIGSALASRCHALGMRVVVVREHADLPSPPAERVFSVGEIDTAIELGDFVVLAVPVTASTTALMNHTRISRMKAGAYLVNVGRGALVDEPALIQALRNNQIGGAALDVFEKEPLPESSELWQMNNVLITPHTAAMSEKTWERHYELIRTNIRHYLANEPLEGLVDKLKGY